MESKFKVKCIKTKDENGKIYDITLDDIYEVFYEFNLNNKLNYIIVTNDIRIENIPAYLFTKHIIEEDSFICPKCNSINKITSYYKEKLQERNMINILTGENEILNFCSYCGHTIEE